MTPRNIRNVLATLIAATALIGTRATAQVTPPAQPDATHSSAVTPLPSAPHASASAPILLGSAMPATSSVEPAKPALLPSGNPNERISINWTALPLSLAIPEIEKLTGRTVIRPATLANVADLNLAFTTPPTRAEALQAIETLFSVNQLSLVPRGEKLLLLVPVNTVRTEAPAFIEGSTLGLPPTGRIATKLFQLEFLRVSEFVASLGTILNPQSGTISIYERANAILVTDSIATLQRIENIIRQVDRPASTPVQAKFYTLEFASASDVVNKLKAIFVGPLQQQLGASTSFNADDRTNQIVVIGDPRQLAFFDDLVKRLDVKTAPNTRSEVIRLNNAQCADVATILGSIIQGQMRAAQGATPTASGGTAQRQFTGAFATQGGNRGTNIGRTGNQGTGGTRGATQGGGTRGATQGGGNRATVQQQSGGTRGQGGGGGQSFGRGGGGGATAQQATGGGMRFGGAATPAFASGGATGGNTGGYDANEFSNYVTVYPDARTNSIVVFGTGDDIRILKELITKLDAFLPQVRIEVVIAEVTVSDQAQSGIDSLGLQVLNGKLVGFNSGGPGFAINGSVGGTGGSNIATLASNYSLSGFLGLTTTPRKNNVSIYSRPAITTAHNSPGRIFFGETRPVVTASSMNDTSGSRTSSVTQQEIGTNIQVTPLIGADGTVQLSLQQTISDVTGTVQVDNNDQYIIGKRETTSTIIVKSGEIIVLGGIQKNSNTKTTNRLGPIPIIGDLLGKRTRSMNRTELIFFLRPVVLTNTPTDNVPAFQQLEGMGNKAEIQQGLGMAVPAESADAKKKKL